MERCVLDATEKVQNNVVQRCVAEEDILFVWLISVLPHRVLSQPAS